MECHMPLSRRNFSSLLAAALVAMASLTTLPAQAASQPWNEKAFQAAGKPILVDVYASW